MVEEASQLWWSWYMRGARKRGGRGEDGASQRGQLRFEPFKCALQDWFSAIPAVKSVCPRSEFVLRGWKDVHFRPEHMRFLEDVFPCSRFIFSVRSNVSSQANSGHFKGQVSAEVLEGKNREILDMHARLGPSRSFLLRLEDFSLDIFADLFGWLGFPNCRPNKLVHDNNKGWTADKMTDRSTILPPGCAFSPH